MLARTMPTGISGADVSQYLYVRWAVGQGEHQARHRRHGGGVGVIGVAHPRWNNVQLDKDTCNQVGYNALDHLEYA
eukprot:1924128-Prymnesium_polylepis.1